MRTVMKTNEWCQRSRRAGEEASGSCVPDARRVLAVWPAILLVGMAGMSLGCSRAPVQPAVAPARPSDIRVEVRD